MKNSSGRNMPEYDDGITPTGTSEVIYFTISFFVLRIDCKSNTFFCIYIIGELEIISNRFKLQNMLIIMSLQSEVSNTVKIDWKKQASFVGEVS